MGTICMVGVMLKFPVISSFDWLSSRSQNLASKFSPDENDEGQNERFPSLIQRRASAYTSITIDGAHTRSPLQDARYPCWRIPGAGRNCLKRNYKCLSLFMPPSRPPPQKKKKCTRQKVIPYFFFSFLITRRPRKNIN